MTDLISYCTKCQGNTNHSIIGEKLIPITNKYINIETKHFLIECNGCSNVSYRKEFHDYDEAYPDEYDEWIHDMTIELYPQVLENHKPLEKIHIIPNEIQTVYSESIAAFKANCLLLAGVGFRAVIEAVCLDKGIIKGDLASKINNLSKGRIITEKEAERLHAIRFMGNDGVHEMEVPEKKALYVVLEIIEQLLKNLYILEHSAKPVLKLYINNFKEFKSLIIQHIKKFEVGDELPLAKYLGKDVRRLNSKINQFETELIHAIIEGSFTELKLGSNKAFGTPPTIQQHFIKT